MKQAAFAIPGDITTVTGGYIYERRLLEGLRAAGRDVAHLVLGDSFPFPTPAHMDDALHQLQALPSDRPLILDGLVSGAIDPAGLAHVKAPIVAMVHHPLALESGLDPARKAHLFETERANLALFRHVLVPSPHTRAILIGQYGVPAAAITIARPGTNRPSLAAQPQQPPLILSVGIQHPRKGHDILLTALARITDLDWQAVIAGGPHDAGHAADLTAQHAALGLKGRVELAGRVEADRLARLFARASVFALATRYEGYGLVFDEALAHGLPIVTCATGAVPDTVPQDAGLLVPPEAPIPFADALRQVLTETGIRRGMAGASARSGATLPTWTDTAAVAGRVLDGLGERP